MGYSGGQKSLLYVPESPQKLLATVTETVMVHTASGTYNDGYETLAV